MLVFFVFYSHRVLNGFLIPIFYVELLDFDLILTVT